MPVRPQRMMRVWKAVCAWREEAAEEEGVPVSPETVGFLSAWGAEFVRGV